METLRLTCPECTTVFDYIIPRLKFLEPGVKTDRAPARCPQGHVHIYEIVSEKPDDDQ